MTSSGPGRGVRRLAAALALSVIAVFSGCSNGTAGPEGSGAASVDMTFNKSDVKFAQTLIPHHEQSIEMSDILLARSESELDVAKLAQQVKDTQRPQVNTMNGLLTAWNQPLIPDHSAEADENHWDADGVLTPEEMQALAAADSPTAQQLFLKGMIQHHKGTVVMVQNEIDNGQNRDAVKLAEDIKDGQTTEIRAMEGLLRGH